MVPFTAKFRIDHRGFDMIITPLDRVNRQFKAELTSGDPNPAIITHLETGEWQVDKQGRLAISGEQFQFLGQAIQEYLDKIYSLHTILILTDFSDSAFNAARFALSVTKQVHTSVVILYHSFYSPPVAGEVPLQSMPEDTYETCIKTLMEWKHKLMPMADKDTAFHVLADERPLASAVQMLADQHQAGLVVMGTTGKSNLEQLLVGSNTLTITKETSAPLLVVPRTAEPGRVKRAVFACDLEEVKERIPADSIKKLIGVLGAKLFILNVDHNERDHFNPDRIKEQSDLHAIWDSVNPEYHYTDSPDITEGILQFAADHDIHMVITVPKQHGFFESLFRQSKTKQLALHTTVPLLLLRENR